LIDEQGVSASGFPWFILKKITDQKFYMQFVQSREIGFENDFEESFRQNSWV
jgi:hypothetical protein